MMQASPATKAATICVLSTNSSGRSRTLNLAGGWLGGASVSGRPSCVHLASPPLRMAALSKPNARNIHHTRWRMRARRCNRGQRVCPHRRQVHSLLRQSDWPEARCSDTLRPDPKARPARRQTRCLVYAPPATWRGRFHARVTSRIRCQEHCAVENPQVAHQDSLPASLSRPVACRHPTLPDGLSCSGPSISVSSPTVAPRKSAGLCRHGAGEGN